jgi:multidrug efflux system outer membrane protein
MKKLGLIFLGVLAGGCTVGPNYQAPKPALSASFGAAAGPGGEGTVVPPSAVVPGVEAVARWWRVFNDPELNALVQRAVHDNRDLKLAVSRLRQARAQRLVVSAGLWPQVDATGGFYRGRGSQNVVIPAGAFGGSGAGAPSGGGSTSTRRVADATSGGGSSGSGSGPPPGGPNNPLGDGGLPGVVTNLYQAGFDASYELDLFGGTRRAIEAAEANVAGAEEARRATLVSLLAEVASTYVGLREQQSRLEIARQNLASQSRTLTIVHQKEEAGFGTDLDVALQSAQVAATAAALPALESAERDSVHRLAVLLGENEPEALSAELAAPAGLPPVPPQVPIGVPSDLLRRRPDIRGAERQLAAANAQVGVATAALFPSFSLTGTLGLDSSTRKALPNWGSRYYSISPGLSWPILDWGRLRANIRVEDELKEQAWLNYQNAITQALQEVADALVHYRAEQVRRLALNQAVAASQASLTLARQKADQGLTDTLSVLEAQRSLLSAQDALAQCDGTIRTDLIALYKALGGGWE